MEKTVLANTMPNRKIIKNQTIKKKSNMKIEGTFQGYDPIVSGVSQTGNPWQRTYFEIITNEGERSKRVAFVAFGNVVDKVRAVQKGTLVEVTFALESRDYVDKNGQKRYGTDASCYGLAVITKQSVQPQQAQPAIQAEPSVVVTQPGQPAPQSAPSPANFPGVNSANTQPLPEGTTMNVQGAGGAGQYSQEFPY